MGREMSGVFPQALDSIWSGGALSRRRRGFETPWDCHTVNKRMHITSFVAHQSFVSMAMNQLADTLYKEVKK